MQLIAALTVFAALVGDDRVVAADLPSPHGQHIGYTEGQTNVPGGQHANWRTNRAHVVRRDGSGRRTLASELANDPDASTQFVGWSPDGKTAIVGRGWESPENARWEEEHKTFRFTKEGWLYDSFLIDLDTPSFHSASSDTPEWSADGKSIFYTAQSGTSVELFRATLDGKTTQLTKSAGGTLHYHPKPSPDGEWIAYGSKRDGVRNLYVMRLDDRAEQAVTNLKPGRAAMHASWQPVTNSN